ncbi:MAG: hypothetical protein CMJ31_04170 [Phycisphaerae bacterium]|nr:hypothetical protein [Phycisphaerae bacterium]
MRWMIVAVGTVSCIVAGASAQFEGFIESVQKLNSFAGLNGVELNGFESFEGFGSDPEAVFAALDAGSFVVSSGFEGGGEADLLTIEGPPTGLVAQDGSLVLRVASGSSATVTTFVFDRPVAAVAMFVQSAGGGFTTFTVDNGDSIGGSSFEMGETEIFFGYLSNAGVSSFSVTSDDGVSFVFDGVVFGGGCSGADLAPPFAELDIADVVDFLKLFGGQDAAADLAAPAGSFDVADVVAFLRAFGDGCP